MSYVLILRWSCTGSASPEYRFFQKAVKSLKGSVIQSMRSDGESHCLALIPLPESDPKGKGKMISNQMTRDLSSLKGVDTSKVWFGICDLSGLKGDLPQRKNGRLPLIWMKRFLWETRAKEMLIRKDFEALVRRDKSVLEGIRDFYFQGDTPTFKTPEPDQPRKRVNRPSRNFTGVMLKDFGHRDPLPNLKRSILVVELKEGQKDVQAWLKTVGAVQVSKSPFYVAFYPYSHASKLPEVPESAVGGWVDKLAGLGVPTSLYREIWKISDQFDSVWYPEEE